LVFQNSRCGSVERNATEEVHSRKLKGSFGETPRAGSQAPADERQEPPVERNGTEEVDGPEPAGTRRQRSSFEPGILIGFEERSFVAILLRTDSSSEIWLTITGTPTHVFYNNSPKKAFNILGKISNQYRVCPIGGEANIRRVTRHLFPST